MMQVFSLQITIFLLVAIGFLLKRIGIVNHNGQKALNNLVINVILPCNTVEAFISGNPAGKWKQFAGILLISIVVQLAEVGYGKLIFRNQADGRRRCLEYGLICPNGGFMGNPIAEGVYGSQGLVLASIFLIPQRIMMWSNGVATFSRQTQPRAIAKKVLTHPCIIACEIGMVMMVAGWQFPLGINTTVSALGNCNTGLSMMVIGMVLADMNLKELWDPTVAMYTLQRLIVLPLIVFVVCMFIPVAHKVMGTAVLMTAMPAGATTTILAERYDVEPEFATKMVIMSTLASLPTILIGDC